LNLGAPLGLEPVPFANHFGAVAGLSTLPPFFTWCGVLMLIPVYLLFALCVGLTIVEIPPAELGSTDLLVAFAALAYFVMSGWLLQEITAVLKNLEGM
jgi:hypothetical protein